MVAPLRPAGRGWYNKVGPVLKTPLTRFRAAVHRPNRRMALATAAALTFSLLVALPAQAAPRPAVSATAADDPLPSQRPPDQKTPLVPSEPRDLPTPPSSPIPESAAPSSVTWPTADSVQISVPARVGAAPSSASAALTPSSAQRVSGTPILLRGSGKAAIVSVQVADRAATRSAGVNGVLFSVGSLPGGTVGVDYSGFASAGAGYGARLHLVTLPACALTTPQLQQCRQQTPVTSTNDAAAKTVSAALPASDARSVSSSSSSKAGTAASGTVMAAVAGASGANGDFTASSLAPSGSWSVSGGTGGFNWSYPLTLPPAAAGGDVSPSVALSYSSASVDGQITTTNNQSSWVGEGWDYQPGYVERTYQTCAEDPNKTTASTTGDQCWAGQIVTMNLGGSTVSLVQDDTTHEWHPQNDSGQKVELVNAPTTGGYQGEYWKVTTTDGVQYFFGRNKGPGWTTQTQTNSTFTEPVYGAHAGDPCYNAAGFAQSSCTQAWRWNLDFVEDPHGNVAAYYYTPETNYYGADMGTTGVAYTRGGYLSKIDYGLRDEAGTIYAHPAPDEVIFGVNERCITTTGTGAFNCDTPANFTTANAAHWPDTPVDQNCTQGATCANNSPTFFSRKRLTSITTQYYNGTSYVKVDAYALGQSFPTSDTAGDQELELDSITRTGYTAAGVGTALPAINFVSTALDNRVQNYNSQPPMAHFRLTRITTETGAQTDVSYSQKECTATHVPNTADLAHNTMMCFPVYWTLPFQTTPTLDFFHKYVVTQVTTQDVLALSPTQETDYTYLGSPAWHLDDNELVKPGNRTYGQFRGYPQVEVRTGSTANSSNGTPDQQTLVKSSYLRGMGGTVTNSLGQTVADNNEYAGDVYETQSFNGDGGAQLSTTTTSFETLATTSTRARPGGTPALPALIATMSATQDSTVTTNLAGSSTSTKSSSFSYDTIGRQIQETDTGTAVPDLCTSTTYADNTTSWIRNRVAETTTAQACTGSVLSDVRSFYDNSTTLGQVPTFGDVTESDTETTAGHWAKATGAFDTSGRPITTKTFISATDTTGRTSTIAYTPSDSGPLTSVYSTNAVSQHTTTTLDPGRGVATKAVDIAGHTTTAAYDALGRLTSVWKPGQVQGTNPATTTYSYLLRSTGPLAVTTGTLVNIGASQSYVNSISLFDEFGGVIQTQADAEGTAGNRVVTDTAYDSHGWPIATNGAWYTAGAPSTTLVATTATQIPTSGTTSYDGAGRTTVSTELHYGAPVPGDTTQTFYAGDRTTVIPPTGGVTQTTVIDARGKPTAVQQYSTAPAVSGGTVSGGVHQDTTYTYDALGRQTGMTDPGGAQWSTIYDLAGRVVSQTDPDTGTSITGYNDAGDVASTTDARGTTLTYTYDALGRKTAEANGATQLASWVYDTLQAGQPTSSTRITSGGNYVVAAVGYDAYGNSTGSTTTIPALSGTGTTSYTTKYTWTSTHLEATEVPLAAGSLAAETLTRAYTRLGNPVSTVGAVSYVSATSYSPFGEATQLSLGTNNQAAWLTYTRDPSTHRMTEENLSIQAAVAQVDDIAYSYNNIGDITKSSEAQGSTQANAPTETTCYTYNALDQLTQAWTASSCTTPAKGSITGPQPYWTSWTIDPSGNRTAQVQHGTAVGSGDTSTAYAYTTTGHAHATSTATTTSPTGVVSTATYGYNQDGSTLTRSGVSTGYQTISYDVEGRTATVTAPGGTTSYIYDANGNQLERKDPTGTTVFLPNEQVSKNSAGTITGYRWYSQGGVVVAERITNLLYDSFTDINGTNTVNIPNITGGFGTAIRRHTDSYGNAIGTPTGTWLDQNGYLGQPKDDATGITDAGARKYDPTLGKFLSVDPILSPYSPQQNNGYSYGWNNPLSDPDPTGAMPSCGGPDGEGCHSALSKETGAKFVNPGDGYTPPAQDTGAGSAGDDGGCDRGCDDPNDGGGNGGGTSTTPVVTHHARSPGHNHGEPINSDPGPTPDQISSQKCVQAGLCAAGGNDCNGACLGFIYIFVGITVLAVGAAVAAACAPVAEIGCALAAGGAAGGGALAGDGVESAASDAAETGGSISSQVADQLNAVKAIAGDHGVPLSKFGDGYLWANKDANLALQTPEQVAAVEARGFTQSQITTIRDYYQGVDTASGGANPSASYRARLMQYYLDNWGN